MILSYFLFTQTTAIVFMHVSSGILQIIQIQFLLGKLSRNIWRGSSFRKAGILKKSFDLFILSMMIVHTDLVFLLCSMQKCRTGLRSPMSFRYRVTKKEKDKGVLLLVCRCKISATKLWVILLKLNFHVISCYLNKEHSFNCTYKNLTRYIIKSSISDTTLSPGSDKRHVTW